MKELHIEKEITLEQLEEHWFEIEDPYTTDENKAIDFNFSCADWFALFSEEFKTLEDFFEWLEDDDHIMNTNLIYYPESKQMLLMFCFEEEDYTYSYITIKDGPGKDRLIELCEKCCKEECDQTCEEFLADV